MMDGEKIEALSKGPAASEITVKGALEKAALGKGLDIEEASVLLNIEDAVQLAELYKKAGEVKERLFGKRVVLFAPLYLSNYCTNGCVYCGFRNAGTGVSRKALTPGEVVSEASALEEMGFKRVLLVTGEDPRYGVDYIISCVRAVYEKTGIRVVHLNAPPMDVTALKELKASGVAVYQVFQETYHRPTYDRMHPFGRKRDYPWRLGVMDRALSAGFKDVGIGVLLGLYDFRFDCLSTIAHSAHLYEKFGTHAHTISVPRLRPAAGSMLESAPHPVTDEEMKKITAVFRLSVPTAGVVVSTRESPALRSALIHIGATQLSAASKTNPGGYAKGETSATEQFSTDDHRGLEAVMRSVMEEGLVPSLCTSCYRTGRTGAEFTERTISGSMEKFCSANAALTLKEYSRDYAKNGITGLIEGAVKRSVDEIKDPKMKKALLEKLKELEKGKRDVFF